MVPRRPTPSRPHPTGPLASAFRARPGERGAEALPGVVARGEEERAGGFDVEAVDDAAAQAALADAVYKRETRDERVEQDRREDLAQLALALQHLLVGQQLDQRRRVATSLRRVETTTHTRAP